MMKLTEEQEIEFATFWDAIGIRVADSGPTGVQLLDKVNEDTLLAILPRTLYTFLTTHLMDLYGSADPSSVRESILQELA